MAAGFDVSARLADGRGALDAAEAYVSASRLRGYAHPDLTRYSGQVLDWYGALDGLDLDALDADCRALSTAAGRAGAALSDVRVAVAGLPEAWRGQGAARVTEFLAGNCETAHQLVEALQISQSCCAALRDELRQLVDRRVSATVAMGQQGRPEWLPAAQAVLAGDPDRADAGQIVDNQVKPFVDKVIRGEWLVAMQSSADSVDAAYRAAITRVGALGGLVFEVPGGFLPQNAAPSPPTPVQVRGRSVAEPEAAAAAPASVTATPRFPSVVPDLSVPAPAAAPWVPAAAAGAPRNALDTFASGIPQPPAMQPPVMQPPALPTFGAGIPAPGFPPLPELGPAGPGVLSRGAAGPMDNPELDVPRLGGSDEGAAPDAELKETTPGKSESEIPAEGEAEAEDVEGTAIEADFHADGSEPPDDVPESAVDTADAPAPVADCPQPAPAAESAPPVPTAAAGPREPAAEPSLPAPDAASEPPPQADSAPPAKPETPCEIAADELPHVGE